MYLVAVTFDVVPAQFAAFKIRMAKQAADSLTEPGCQRFDVWADPEGAPRVFLYEIYDDRAAFDAHLDSAHFKDFDAAVGPWLEGKAVETHTLGAG